MNMSGSHPTRRGGVTKFTLQNAGIIGKGCHHAYKERLAKAGNLAT